MENTGTKLERKAIFHLMVANEGRSYIPVYVNYTNAGFRPERDQLQVPVYPPEIAGFHGPWTEGPGSYHLRDYGFVGGGGPVFDWDLRTTLPGLYVAGQALLGGGSHATSAVTGRYAGRKAAEAAAECDLLEPLRSFIEQEKQRIYEPLSRSRGTGWKELQAGVCRVMQDYCGEFKSEKTMRLGLRWFEEIAENEAADVYANNPHELWRVQEALSRITVGKLILESSLARRASSRTLDFNRLDYPEYDPPEWNKFVTVKLEDGQIKTDERPQQYWLLPPYSSQYADNYRLHSGKRGAGVQRR
ncbi:hypothetical protein [Paenibacillus sp. HW567]|uniref:hypothetical protein n=1 Tax=Paenibacillus sp. HW567 TaxID=1034769 RepID=UPI000372D135|nr:hypothetical protein [Paenibacillus sp. HW567]